MRQFVGFVGYYRRFVKNFAELADPLVSLTRKGVPFVWGSEQQRAFDAVKACLLSLLGGGGGGLESGVWREKTY